MSRSNHNPYIQSRMGQPAPMAPGGGSYSPGAQGLDSLYAMNTRDPLTGEAIQHSDFERMQHRAQLQGAPNTYNQRPAFGADPAKVQGNYTKLAGLDLMNENNPDTNRLGAMLYGGASNAMAYMNAYNAARGKKGKPTGDGGVGAGGQRAFAGMQAPQSTDDGGGDESDEEPDDISARAKGGPVKNINPYLVGEKGPEVFVPKKGQPEVIGAQGPEVRTFPQHGTIIPNHKIQPRVEGGRVTRSGQPWINETPEQKLAHAQEVDRMGKAINKPQSQRSKFESASPAIKALTYGGETLERGLEGAGKGIAWPFVSPETWKRWDNPLTRPMFDDEQAPQSSTATAPQASNDSPQTPQPIKPGAGDDKWGRTPDQIAAWKNRLYGDESHMPENNIPDPAVSMSVPQLEERDRKLTEPGANQFMSREQFLPKDQVMPKNPYNDLTPQQHLLMAGMDSKQGITSRGDSGSVTFSNGGGVSVDPTTGQRVAYGPHVTPHSAPVQFTPGHVIDGKNGDMSRYNQAPTVTSTAPAPSNKTGNPYMAPNAPAPYVATESGDMGEGGGMAQRSGSREDAAYRRADGSVDTDKLTGALKDHLAKVSTPEYKANAYSLVDATKRGIDDRLAKSNADGTPALTPTPNSKFSGSDSFSEMAGNMPPMDRPTPNSRFSGSDPFSEMLGNQPSPTSPMAQYKNLNPYNPNSSIPLNQAEKDDNAKYTPAIAGRVNLGPVMRPPPGDTAPSVNEYNAGEALMNRPRTGISNSPTNLGPVSQPPSPGTSPFVNEYNAGEALANRPRLSPPQTSGSMSNLGPVSQPPFEASAPFVDEYNAGEPLLNRPRAIPSRQLGGMDNPNPLFSGITARAKGGPVKRTLNPYLSAR